MTEQTLIWVFYSFIRSKKLRDAKKGKLMLSGVGGEKNLETYQKKNQPHRKTFISCNFIVQYH